MNGIHEVTGSTPVSSTRVLDSGSVIAKRKRKHPFQEGYSNLPEPGMMMAKEAEQSVRTGFIFWRALAALPILLVLFFYAWSLTERYGAVLGLHIFILAVSAFYLFTPLPSYLYVLGLLPGSTHRRARMPIVAWLFLAWVNVATFYLLPALYRRTPITGLIAYIVTTPVIRFALPILSLGSLLYHWFVTHIDNLTIRILAHIIGIVTSAFILSNVYWMHRDSLVVCLNVGSLNF